MGWYRSVLLVALCAVFLSVGVLGTLQEEIASRAGAERRGEKVETPSNMGRIMSLKKAGKVQLAMRLKKSQKEAVVKSLTKYKYTELLAEGAYIVTEIRRRQSLSKELGGGADAILFVDVSNKVNDNAHRLTGGNNGSSPTRPDEDDQAVVGSGGKSWNVTGEDDEDDQQKSVNVTDDGEDEEYEPESLGYKATNVSADGNNDDENDDESDDDDETEALNTTSLDSVTGAALKGIRDATSRAMPGIVTNANSTKPESKMHRFIATRTYLKVQRGRGRRRRRKAKRARRKAKRAQRKARRAARRVKRAQRNARRAARRVKRARRKAKTQSKQLKRAQRKAIKAARQVNRAQRKANKATRRVNRAQRKATKAAMRANNDAGRGKRTWFGKGKGKTKDRRTGGVKDRLSERVSSIQKRLAASKKRGNKKSTARLRWRLRIMQRNQIDLTNIEKLKIRRKDSKEKGDKKTATRCGTMIKQLNVHKTSRTILLMEQRMKALERKGDTRAALLWKSRIDKAKKRLEKRKERLETAKRKELGTANEEEEQSGDDNEDTADDDALASDEAAAIKDEESFGGSDDGLGLGSGDGLGLGSGDELGLGSGDGLGLGSGDELGLGSGDGLGLDSGDGLGLGSGDGLGLGSGDGLGLGSDDELGLGSGDELGIGSDDELGDNAGDGDDNDAKIRLSSIKSKIKEFREKLKTLKGPENKKARQTLNRAIKNMKKRRRQLRFRIRRIRRLGYDIRIQRKIAKLTKKQLKLLKSQGKTKRAGEVESKLRQLKTKISILVRKQKYAKFRKQQIKKGFKKDLKDFRANVQKQEKVVKVRNEGIKTKLQKYIQKKIQGKGQKKKKEFLSTICKEGHYCNDKVKRLRNSENAIELEEATNIVEGLMMKAVNAATSVSQEVKLSKLIKGKLVFKESLHNLPKHVFKCQAKWEAFEKKHCKDVLDKWAGHDTYAKKFFRHEVKKTKFNNKIRRWGLAGSGRKLLQATAEHSLLDACLSMYDELDQKHPSCVCPVFPSAGTCGAPLSLDLYNSQVVNGLEFKGTTGHGNGDDAEVVISEKERTGKRFKDFHRWATKTLQSQVTLGTDGMIHWEGTIPSKIAKTLRASCDNFEWTARKFGVTVKFTGMTFEVVSDGDSVQNRPGGRRSLLTTRNGGRGLAC
jgi:hypothetical protein